MEQLPDSPAAAAAAASPAAPSSLDFDPVPVRYRRDGWTPARQRAFIAALADCRCVLEACRRVGKSAEAAYKLSRRPDAAGLRSAWHAALAARPSPPPPAPAAPAAAEPVRPARQPLVPADALRPSPAAPEPALASWMPSTSSTPSTSGHPWQLSISSTSSTSEPSTSAAAAPLRGTGPAYSLAAFRRAARRARLAPRAHGKVPA